MEEIMISKKLGVTTDWVKKDNNTGNYIITPPDNQSVSTRIDFYFEKLQNFGVMLIFEKCHIEVKDKRNYWARLTFGGFAFLECIFATDFIIMRATFKEEVTFFKCIFLSDFEILLSVFEKKLIFMGVTFDKSHSFSLTHFKESLFFEKIINKTNPFFSQCNYEVSNFLTIRKIHRLKFDEIASTIKTRATKENNNPRQDDFITSQYEERESYRFLKDCFIKQNDLLNASDCSCLELYCKEIELDSKPKKTFQDKIDKWQLWFYRKTSDHHTNLAKIINSVIMLIALFGIFSYTITTYKEKHLNYERQYFGSVMGSAVDLSIRKESYSLTKTDKIELENRAKLDKTEAFLIVSLCILFIAFFIILIALTNTKYKILSWIFNGLAYIVFFCVIVYKPTLLLPFVGQLFDEGLKTNFPAMQSLSVVYCILMVLMIFSLQKTARKNSIVPS